MQHNVVLGQVIMPNSIMMYYIHNVLWMPMAASHNFI
jgi:hypothetical protein